MKKFILAVVASIISCTPTSTESEVLVRPDMDNLQVQAKPPPSAFRRLTLDCGRGESAGAGGTYGGVDVGLSCTDGGVSSTVIEPVGNVYTFRVGVETSSVAVDYLLFGDDDTFRYKFLNTTFVASNL